MIDLAFGVIALTDFQTPSHSPENASAEPTQLLKGLWDITPSVSRIKILLPYGLCLVTSYKRSSRSRNGFLVDGKEDLNGFVRREPLQDEILFKSFHFIRTCLVIKNFIGKGKNLKQLLPAFQLINLIKHPVETASHPNKLKNFFLLILGKPRIHEAFLNCFKKVSKNLQGHALIFLDEPNIEIKVVLIIG